MIAHSLMSVGPKPAMNPDSCADQLGIKIRRKGLEKYFIKALEQHLLSELEKMEAVL